MRDRPLPPADELLAALAELGATDAPREGPPGRLEGLLDLALFLAERQKEVSFPGFSWDDPRFVARDAKVAVPLAYAALERADEASVRGTLLAHLPRVAEGGLLALDARPSGVREYELAHALYGRVTLFEHRVRPPESADPRLDAARETGWVRTLKEHNLLPGRGLVVLDEHQGLLLREPALEALRGVLVLLPSGHTHLWWNPVARGADPAMQDWLAWGRGLGGASEWRELLRVEERDGE